MIDGFDILEAIDVHQVIGRDVNPAGAEHTLAPGPEALPTTLIHAMRDAKSETFEVGKDCEFVGFGFQRF